MPTVFSSTASPSTPPASSSTQNLKEQLLTVQELRAQIVSNVIRRWSPTFFGMGAGLGMAYAEGNQMLTAAHEQLREHAAAEHRATPPGLPPSLPPWEIMIMGPPDTIYEGGFFRALLTFPQSYPQQPPTLRFTTAIWHPNVYSDGTVCISILHAPGEDKFGYERPEERWLPIHTVESILLSVISMLSAPNADSPANVQAAKELREQPEVFRKRVQRLVRESQEE